MAHPELLAKHASTEYVPLTLKGVDGSSFKNELLHLIGFEADSKEAYLQLYSFYIKVGNRWAACLCAYKLIEKYRQDDVRVVKKSKYLQTIDSLIQIYQDIPEAGGQEFFKKAMAHPELLAKHASTEYVPLTLKGVDGSSFKNDLLHIIGFEEDSKEAYLQLYTYYNKVGNRGAACLCAYKLNEKYRQDDVREVKKSKYLQIIDSLIQIYQDIPEAGELAVEHFRFMEGATDAKPQDKLNYINYALSR